MKERALSPWKLVLFPCPKTWEKLTETGAQSGLFVGCLQVDAFNAET